MNIDLIAGARPNFMKIASIIKAIIKAQKDGANIKFRLIHTGQHFDHNMSQSFFEQLNIPAPDINLGSGGGTAAEQTAKIMIGYEAVLMDNPCDLCIVVGDVNSTMACSIVAKKLNIKVAHVEAGIRSGDLTMPEEINRLVTDSITDYFFTTSEVANENLKKCGIPSDRIFFVGNTMIDTLLDNEDRFCKPEFWDKASLSEKNYIILTLHRPSNVDDESNLKNIILKIISSVGGIKIIFPIHPRTRKKLGNIILDKKNLFVTEPLSYLEFNYLVQNSLGVITDSGGITEETTVMGIPCMTLRANTERPETVLYGTNELLGTDKEAIPPYIEKMVSGNWKTGSIPPLWDGKAAERIVTVIIQKFSIK
jgi:UDP-N-acetylglucosamine 2-epimerase (non-hydrolysing)